MVRVIIFVNSKLIHGYRTKQALSLNKPKLLKFRKISVNINNSQECQKSLYPWTLLTAVGVCPCRPASCGGCP